MRPPSSATLIAAALVAATLALFAPAFGNDFVNYDDPLYVTENRPVQAGLTWAGVGWACTTTTAANWHPLTWLSLQLDASLHGTESAWGFRVTNVLLHAAGAAVLFLALRRATGLLWRPALVAALFAVHPLHVESVVWIAERKDVLSGLFWMLTLLAYVCYTERPGARRYLLVLAAFGLGLLAKPMLVTLPCVLLLLDYWPLRRPWAPRLVWEKLPLLALSAAACVVTVFAQQAGGAVRTLASVPLWLRVENTLVSYVQYVVKAVRPIDLAVFYPYPAAVPAWQALAAGAGLAVVTAVAVRLRCRCPYLLIGWLWFLGTLVPVIGLVQVGEQALADRYSYIPLIGLFLAAVWGGADALARWRAAGAKGVLAGLILAFFSLLTVAQSLYWHDSVTLWEHARAVTPPNAVAENSLGTALEERGNITRAARHYAEAMRLAPENADYRYNFAGALAEQKQLEAAVHEYEAALRIAPDHVQSHINFALLLARTGQTARAIEHFRLAGEVYARRGEAEASAAAFRSAEDLRRKSPP